MLPSAMYRSPLSHSRSEERIDKGEFNGYKGPGKRDYHVNRSEVEQLPKLRTRLAQAG